MKSEGNWVRSSAMEQSVQCCRSGHLSPNSGVGPTTLHLDVLPCQARPARAQQVSCGAGPAAPGAQHQDVLNRESWASACPLGQHCPLGLVFYFILDGQRICSDWPSRWPKCHWPEEQLDKDPFLKGSGLSHLCPSGSPTHE